MEKKTNPAFFLKQINPDLACVFVTVPSHLVDAVFSHTSHKQRKSLHIHGFPKGATPLDYIEQHFKNHISDHIKEFLFKYTVLPFLYENLYKEKVTLAGEPRLIEIDLEPHTDAIYQFHISPIPAIEFKDWRSFPFKAPKRKKYKDIDKQVETFIAYEEKLKKEKSNDGIQVGDWVCFDIAVVDEYHNPILENHKENLWLKIGNEESDNASRDMFLDKKISSSFYSDSSCFQHYFNTESNTFYNFQVNIIDTIYNDYFCFNAFKKHFNIKSQKDLAKKLVEVYSFRNDLSQRRSIVEEGFKTLFSKHSIDIPSHVALRQQKNVLDAVRENPDYQVYKTEKQFEKFIRLLALKQIKEEVIVDQLMHHEKITTTHDDIKSYLTFTQRPRMKEFLYFRPPPTKYRNQEMPISSSVLGHYCKREKILNYVLQNLARK